MKVEEYCRRSIIPLLKYWEAPTELELERSLYPFNAICFYLDAGRACVDSGSFDERRSSFTAAHGLYNHRFEEGCEPIPASELMLQLARAFAKHKRFASMRKSLPFFFVFDETASSPATGCTVLLALDEATIEDGPHAPLYREAHFEPIVLSPEERLARLLPNAKHSQYDSNEADELFALADEDESGEILTQVLEEAWELRFSCLGDSWPNLTERLWALGEQHQTAVLEFFEEVFLYEVEELGHKPLGVLLVLSEHLICRMHIWQHIPARHRDRLRDAYEDQVRSYLNHSEPLARMIAEEVQAGVDFINETNGLPFMRSAKPDPEESGPDLSGLSDDHVRAVCDAVAELEAEIDNADWGELIKRLSYLGHRAAASIPVIEDLLVGYLDEEIRIITPADRHGNILDLAWLLYQLGSQNIPAPVAAYFAQEGQLSSHTREAFYDDWSRRAARQAAGSDSQTVAARPTRRAAPLAGESFETLRALLDDDPYAVFRECERRHAKAKPEGEDLFVLARDAAAAIEVMLLDSPPDLDEITSAVMDFSSGMEENVYVEDDEPEGAITEALEVLERRLSALSTR